MKKKNHNKIKPITKRKNHRSIPLSLLVDLIDSREMKKMKKSREVMPGKIFENSEVDQRLKAIASF